MGSSKGRLLFVDDNVSFLEHCLYWFEDDYEVHKATSGEDALKLVSFSHFDVLIADYKLPNMDGIELIKQVKRFRSDIPSIILTDFGDLSSAKAGVRLGIGAYIEKNELSCETPSGIDTEFIKKGADLNFKFLEDTIDRIIARGLKCKIVSIMNKALWLWGNIIDKTNVYSKYVHKAEFAEKSGLWRVQDQNGIKRTRGLDRYLELAKLPYNPNKDLVLRSVDYVLNYCKMEDDSLWRELKTMYDELERFV
jgi:CheY-like chemotaxis protein